MKEQKAECFALHTAEAFSSAYSLFRGVSGRVALILMRTNALSDTALNDKAYGISSLLVALGGTCGGILKVGDHPAFVEQAVMLGRAAFEQAINVAYVAVSEDSIHQDLVDHALQRRYRQMNQTAGKGNVKVVMENVNRPTNLSEHPELEAALDRFTSKNGRPKSWTDKTVEERIDVISATLPEGMTTVLLLGKLSIYGKASEALHGSLAGATIIETPHFAFDEDKQDFDWGKHAETATALYITLARVLEVLIWILGQTTGSSEVKALHDSVKQEIQSFFQKLKSVPIDSIRV